MRPPPYRDDDTGFTLVELVVTMFVIAVALLGLMTVQVGSLSVSEGADQRQQATGIANRTLELVRALPATTVRQGLRATDASLSDADVAANISGSCASACRFRPVYDASIDEAMVVGTTQSAAPLFPSLQPAASTTVGAITYKTAVYVSQATGQTDSVWVSVVTTWSSNVSRGRRTVAVRSIVATPGAP